jgi:hypothetical protein
MRYGRRSMQISLVALMTCLGMAVSCKKATDPGIAAATFNKRFLPTIQPGMTYEQIAKIAGSRGEIISEDKNASPPIVQYRWNGGKNSVLTVKFGSDRMMEATILAPNGHKYLIQNSGEISNITK